MNTTLRRSLIGGSAAVAVAAGITVYAVPALAQQPTADQILRNAANVAKSTTSTRATLNVTTSDSRLGGPIVVEVWGEKPSKGRAVVVQAPLTDLNGVVAVSDGKQGWLYQKSENKVITATEADFADLKKQQPNAAKTAMSWDTAVDEVLANANVKLLGTEGNSYKLEVTPKDPAKGNGISTVWIDRASWIVNKATVTSPEGNATIEARNVEINPAIDPKQFTFQVPANAQVVPAASLKPQPLTEQQARALSSVRVMLPTYLPAGAQLDGISKVGDGVVARYSLGKGGYTVSSFTASTAPRAGRDAEKTTIHGQTATVVTDRDGVAIYWQENGTSYVVAGSLSVDEAKKVAESTK